MKNILITGVTGYIGSNLIKALKGKYNIFGVVRKTSDVSEVKDYCHLVFVEDLEDCFRQNKIDLVLHLATNYNRKFGNDYIAVEQDNVIFPLKILSLCKKYGITRFFNLDTCIHPHSNLYSFTKKIFKEWLKYLCIPATNIILQHFYGHGNTNGDFISFVIQEIKSKKEKINLTHGTQKRDFIYISDVVDAIMLLMEQRYVEQYIDVQLGSGTDISIKNIVQMIKDISNSDIRLHFGVIDTKFYDMSDYVADISYLKSLGWHPKVNLKDGLIKCINN